MKINRLINIIKQKYYNLNENMVSITWEKKMDMASNIDLNLILMGMKFEIKSALAGNLMLLVYGWLLLFLDFSFSLF